MLPNEQPTSNNVPVSSNLIRPTTKSVAASRISVSAHSRIERHVSYEGEGEVDDGGMGASGAGACAVV